MLKVGIDIGGTKIAGGVVDQDGRILEKVRVDTPDNAPEGSLEEPQTPATPEDQPAPPPEQPVVAPTSAPAQ